MPSRSRQKGDRQERRIVELHRKMGVCCERIPLSGAMGGSFSGDLLVDGELRAEVKSRANGEGFRTLEKWKGENDILFLHRDRQLPLVVMDWDTYARWASPLVGEGDMAGTALDRIKALEGWQRSAVELLHGTPHSGKCQRGIRCICDGCDAEELVMEADDD